MACLSNVTPHAALALSQRRLAGALSGARARGWPLVMGIVNVTPDSFSDGGLHATADDAIDAALTLAACGADVLDIGGESTRPGATPVDANAELDRVLPVIQGVRARSDILLSLDTAKPSVMRAGAAAGVDIINDVNALRGEGALDVVANMGVGCVLMHMKGEPRTMQRCPSYDDVVTEVRAYLLERARLCVDAGINSDAIVIDPGIGFGKNLSHNLTVLKQLHALVETGYPVLVGASRKSMLSTITGRGVGERLAGSVAVALRAAQDGAAMVRVHDVAETVDALKVWASISQARCSP